ncbi:DNA-3-methyladenine glycosylase 1 [Zhongshania aliphaticivorans]|uniref:DNA-3-methyladenine glycosylase 1 n=1 Tax=Zhongshania aliphaticivorans TaxID=1470434 RepID=A0A5S9N2W0_9GAMM|nr:DNA-3-methyladenine glycosylase I [Zhongshania aliphaticivorans]CAA0082750.1 DNA-3-methyladenine glycosylase 1 [Zhongshania aliphaticivorans]CAA0084034.1 DNA-3-methyladenine glycosylase 1 [Zhongshania aliphaticivorans]
MNEPCPWCLASPNYVKYHDEEWGIPSDDEQILFEFLVLESAQAGLSWLTILNKREGYRKAFANFDPHKIIKFDDASIASLINTPEIIRNRLKIKSTITNAKHFLEIQKEYGSFARYMWSYFDNKPIQNNWKTLADVPATSYQSDLISKDMKKIGFKFFGSTICYAYLQALGFVNDHLISCPRHKTCAELGKNFLPHWL